MNRTVLWGLAALFVMMSGLMAEAHVSLQDHRFCRPRSPYYDHYRCTQHRHVDGDDAAIVAGGLLGLTATTASIATTEEKQNNRREMVVRGAVEEYLVGRRSSYVANLMSLVAQKRQVESLSPEEEEAIMEEIITALEKEEAARHSE